MTYKVINDFSDTMDDMRIYRAGDTYPAEGAKKPTAKRIKGLLGKDNKQGRPLIEEVKEVEEVEDVKPDAKPTRTGKK